MMDGGASDRITLDVGGTKFVTGTSTLTTNSSYFALPSYLTIGDPVIYFLTKNLNPLEFCWPICVVA